MDSTLNTTILESLILDSYQDLFSITESIMEIKRCENAYKLDMKSIVENSNTDLADGRTERYNSDKATLIEKAKKKITDFLHYIRDKVIEFYNLFINFLKKTINSDKMLIKKYKNCETVISVEGYKYTIVEVLHCVNNACINFKNYCVNNKTVLTDDKIVTTFRKTIVASDIDINKEDFESIVYRALRSNKSNTETISGTVGDFCVSLDYEKDIKVLYKMISNSKKYFDPKYLKELLDYEITDDNMIKSLEVLNELKNSLLFTLNACKNAINERNTMIRQAINDAVKNEKQSLNESYNASINNKTDVKESFISDDVDTYESVLDKYDIDEVLESDLGLDYFVVESYIGNNEIVTEGVFDDLKDKAIKIIEKVIRFIKTIKEKIVNLVKQKLKKDIKNNSNKKVQNSDNSISDDITENKEKFITFQLDKVNAQAYMTEVTNIIDMVDRLLLRILQMSSKHRFSDLDELKKFNSESHDIDINGIMNKLDSITATKKSITVNEAEMVQDYINDIKKTLVDKFQSIDETMNKMIKYNQNMIKNLKSSYIDPEIVRNITMITNTQQTVSTDYLTLLNAIVDRVNKIENEINQNISMESFISVLDM